MSRSAVVVAIDGPSGVGKTTVARGVARRLGLPYFETGAMYRALGWTALDRRIDLEDGAAVGRLARELDLGYQLGTDGGLELLVDGRPVGDRIRGPEVSEATSRVAVHPEVRERMVALQRRWVAERGAVMEGRDIGTKVFPGTPFKYFLDAPQSVRIERRLEQLRAAGRAELGADGVRAEVIERDRRDSGRKESPLARDGSYVAIDTSRHSAEEVIERIAADVERRGAD